MSYFAYGSNLLASRIRQADRAPCAQPIGRAALEGHSLRFHKRGKDGTGKCDAFATGETADVVHGVLYELGAEHRRSLDRVEGVGNGYRHHTVEVEVEGEGRAVAWLYVAEAGHIAPELLPFCWYRDLVLAGARGNRLPDQYVRRIASHPIVRDSDRRRVESATRLISP